MPDTIIVVNFEEINLQASTSLDADVSAGQGVVIAKNPEDFADIGWIVLGNGDQAELLEIASIVNKNINLAGVTEFDHKQYEQIRQPVGDQAKLFRAINVDNTPPDIGSFVQIGTPTNLLFNQTATEIVDPSGSSNYWYVVSYFNTLTNAQTDLSEATPVRGSNYGHFTTPYRVRVEAGLLNNQYIDEGEITEAIEDAEGTVKASIAIGGYALPLRDDRAYNLARKATKLLAAGYLLTSNNTNGYADVYKQGQDKMKQAQDICNAFESGSIVLLDSLDQVADKVPGGDSVSGPSSDFNCSTPPDISDSPPSSPGNDDCNDIWFGRNTKL